MDRSFSRVLIMYIASCREKTYRMQT